MPTESWVTFQVSRQLRSGHFTLRDGWCQESIAGWKGVGGRAHVGPSLPIGGPIPRGGGGVCGTLKKG